MCGRYAITTAPEAIQRWFKISGTTPNFPAHYNAAPGQELPVIRLHPATGERVLGTLRWGLIPYLSKDPKIAWKCINARGETVKTVGLPLVEGVSGDKAPTLYASRKDGAREVRC